MAKRKKSQVPAPPKPSRSPRPVQAPKKRTDVRPPRDPRRTRVLLAAFAGVAVVAAAIVGIAFVAGGGGEDDAAAALAVGCVREQFPQIGRQHVRELKPGFKYSSVPATSGPHNPTPAVWNLYDQPVEEFRLVHNLEHGGIIAQYGDDVAPSTVTRIIDWYREDPNGMIVAPLPKLGDKIAVTAWTQLMTCSQGFDEEVFSEFRDDYRFKGPEPYPPDALAPGNT